MNDYTVFLYTNRFLKEHKNRVIEQFDDFLDFYGELLFKGNCAPFKINLNSTIIVEFDREFNFANPYISYCVVDDGTGNKRYYFVENYEFLSNKAIRLSLKLDVLQQFIVSSYNLPQITDGQWFVHRCHKDRFINIVEHPTINGNNYTLLYRRFDNIAEGFECTKILDSSIDIKQKYLPNEQWGLIFSTGFYTYNNKVQHETFSASIVDNRDGFSPLNGIIAKTTKDDGSVVDLVQLGTFDNIPNDISNISKILKLPYCPCNIYPYNIDKDEYFFQNEKGSTKGGTERGFAYQFHLGDKFTTLSTAHTESEEGTTPSHTLRLPMLKANNLFDEISFAKYIKVTLNGDISKNQKRFNHMDDSKTYTSEFFNIGFFFENNSVYYPLEEFKLAPVDNVVPIPKINIEYYVSNAMNPTIMFHFNFTEGSKVESSPTDDYLTISGSFEVPIYTDAYLEYLRNGYNYDLKNKEQQTRMAIINSAISIGKGVASTATSSTGVGAVIGAGQTASAVNTLYNTIESQISLDRKWEQQQKLNAEKGASVSGSVDTELREVYYPRLRLVTYKVKATLRNSLNELFFRYGYKVEQYSKPSITNRVWFNFLSADVTFNSELPSYCTKEMEELLRAKISEGVTFFHRQTTLKPDKYLGWDIDQVNENWETSLFKAN